MLKKENEALIKENKEYALAIESIEKDLTNEENRQANEIKKSLDGYKERENNLIAELKTLKSLNEVIKKEVEINKKDLEIFKQKLESKILENTGLKDEIRGMKHFYKQSKKKFIYYLDKEYESQICNYKSQIDSIEQLNKNYTDEIDNLKNANKILKSINNENIERIGELNQKISESEKIKIRGGSKF